MMPVLVAAVAMLIRLWRVGESLWSDELFTLRVVQLSLAEIIAYPEQTPPLHHVLLHGWIQIAGISEPALRLPSVLAGAGAAGLAVVVARRWLDDGAAALAGLLVAAHPGLVLMGQEARAYAFVALFGTVSWWLWLKLMDGARWPVAVGYVATTVALLYTHLYGFFFVAGQGIAWLLIRPKTFAFGRALAIAAAPVVLFAPWARILAGRVAYVSSDFWINSPTLNDMVITMRGFAGATFLLVLHAGLWGVVALHGTRAARGAFVKSTVPWSFAPAIIPYALSFAVPLYRPRYAIPAATGYLMLVAWGANGLSRDLRRICVGVLLGVSIILSLHLIPAFDAGSVRTDWRAGAHYVDAHAEANADVMFWPAYCDSQNPDIELSCPWGYYGTRTDLDLIPFGRSNVGLQADTFEKVEARLGDADSAWLMEVKNAPTGEPVRLWLAGEFRAYDLVEFDDLRVYHYRDRIPD